MKALIVRIHVPKHLHSTMLLRCWVSRNRYHKMHTAIFFFTLFSLRIRIVIYVPFDLCAQLCGLSRFDAVARLCHTLETINSFKIIIFILRLFLIISLTFCRSMHIVFFWFGSCYHICECVVWVGQGSGPKALRFINMCVFMNRSIVYQHGLRMSSTI